MMMHTARRGGVQFFDRRIGRARRENPIIAGPELPAVVRLDREGDFDAVLQNERGSGGGNLDHRGSAGILVPAFDARVPLRRRREKRQPLTEHRA